MLLEDKNMKTSLAAGTLSAICVAPFFIYSIQSPCSSWLSASILTLPLLVAALIHYQGKRSGLELSELYNRIDSNVKSFLFNSGEKKTMDSISELDLNLKEATNFIRHIGEGNFNVGYQGMNDALLELNRDNLSGELVQMKKKMMQVAEKEKQHAWVTNGIAHFAEIVRTQQTEDENVFNHFIAELIRYIGANQGGIFIANQDTEEVKLELKGCYAYGRRKFIQRSIAVGEGLVGQAYQEGDMIYLTDVPANYVSITSGLGEATPRCVVLMPMNNNNSIEGIIEIASFRVWQSFETDFLRRVAEILGSAVSNMKIVQRTNKLLDDSQQQAEQLKAQEDELRQHIEEIHATQETLERKSREAQMQNNKLNAILDATVDGILTFDESGRIETINRAGLDLFGYGEESLVGKSIDKILSETNDEQPGSASLLNNGKISASHKAKAIRNDGTFVHVEVAINGTDLDGKKIFTSIVRDISERIKAEHDQQQYIEELRAQEEELKQNMEELQATQEEMNRQMQETSMANRELDARIAALNTSTIMSEADLYGNILFINDKFCEVSQFSRDELIGKAHKMVRHPDMPAEVFKHMWKTIKAGKVFRGIVKNKKKDGSHYWVDAVISPVLNEEGVPVKYIGVRYVIEDEEQAQKLFLNQLMDLQIGNTVSIKEINNEDTFDLVSSTKSKAMV